jgi:hypothetical protein
LVTASSSRQSSPSLDDNAESQGDFDPLSRTAPARLKTSEDIDKEFKDMFAPDDRFWDPELGAKPIVVNKNGLYDPDKPLAKRAVRAPYVDAVVQGIDGFIPSRQNSKQPAGMSTLEDCCTLSSRLQLQAQGTDRLMTIMQSLAVVRRRTSRLARIS